MPFVNEKTGNDYRTIDYERNVVLSYHGTKGPESPHHFQLKIQDQIINFQAWMGQDRKPNKHYDVQWDIVRLSISGFTQEEKMQIIELIRQALNEFGAFSTRENVEQVQVNFMAPEIN